MIKYIVHISDIHVRTIQLHDMYKRQFELFLLDLKEKLPEDLKREEIRIVVTGDIAHQKINISNEQLMLTSWFLSELTKVGKVIIIPGNHDFLENNTQRLDSITPIVELLNNEDIRYFRDSGVYSDENINWVVYSLYQHNTKPIFKKEKGIFHVGLFHGPIQGLSTDLGYTFEDAYDRLNFIGLDLLLCGDIHKRQTFKLPEGKGLAYMIGSFIQQNFSETINHHGYGIYDIEDKKYEFHDIFNEQPYLHFSISDIKDIDNEKEELLNVG